MALIVLYWLLYNSVWKCCLFVFSTYKKENKEVFQVKEQFFVLHTAVQISTKNSLFKPKTISTKLKSVTNCSIRNRPTRFSNFLPSKSKLCQKRPQSSYDVHVPYIYGFKHNTVHYLVYISYSNHTLCSCWAKFFSIDPIPFFFCELLSFSNRYICVLCLFTF